MDKLKEGGRAPPPAQFPYAPRGRIVAGARSTQVAHGGPTGILEAMVVTPQHVTQKLLKREVCRAVATQDVLFFVLVGFRCHIGKGGICLDLMFGSHVGYLLLLNLREEDKDAESILKVDNMRAENQNDLHFSSHSPW